jgi:23S rRNA (guanosine2251-2'-O)-methyltransferase
MRLIYGINPVLEALKAHPSEIEQILISSGRKRIEKLTALAKKSSAKIEYRPKEELNTISSTTKHQGIVAILSSFSYKLIRDIIERWRSTGEKALIVVLDGIQDPHNLGSIIRTANACGVHGIVIPKDRAAGVTSAVVKASAGATEHIPVARVTNIVTALKTFREEGIWIVGAAGGEKMSIYSDDFNSTMDLAVVIGGEGKGIRPLVKKQCDFLVSIPMRGEVESLNASVSAAVVLYEIIRRRA